MQLTDKEVQSIQHILRKYGVTHAELFGSYARGDADETSDVDVLIDPPPRMSLLGLIRLEHDLEDELGKKVDIVPKRSLYPRLKPYVERDIIPILA